MEYRILGPLEVWHDGEPVAVRGSRQRALLALLVMHANEVLSTDRIVDAIWGDETPDPGGAALRVRVSQLRKALGPGGGQLVTQPPGYMLRLDDGQLDIHTFERLVARAEREPPEVAAEQLRQALALWRGAPLEEFAYEDFAQTAIARLEELRLLALERRVEADLALGRQRDVIPELEALASQHPLREGPVRQLMVALYRSGRQAEALEAFRRSRTVLVNELGLEPTPALQELERSILRHDPALDLAPPAGPERSILVAPVQATSFDHLLAIAEPLARRPPRELVLAQLIASAAELPAASALARQRRESLQKRGVSTRSAAFTTERPGDDLVRITIEQDVDLVLIEAPPSLLDDPVLRRVLREAPCDVGALATRDGRFATGSILVPFTGAEHDWSAIEIAAWIARSQEVSLFLAGPIEGDRDASRLLARASLAVQRALGVAAEPLLVRFGVADLLAASERCSLVVVGLPERWRHNGLGQARLALVRDARPPVLVARRGLRPGGLTPPEGLTRFTWSIAGR